MVVKSFFSTLEDIHQKAMVIEMVGWANISGRLEGQLLRFHCKALSSPGTHKEISVFEREL